MEWSGVEWSGVDWTGLEWSVENGVDWTGLDWNGVPEVLHLRKLQRIFDILLHFWSLCSPLA